MGLQYDGIDLAYTLTESIAQESVYDPSHTDRLYTRFEFRVSAIVNKDVVPALVGEAPAETLKRLEHRLLAPRKRLVYTAPGGANFIDTDEDDMNGPQPTAARVL